MRKNTINALKRGRVKSLFAFDGSVRDDFRAKGRNKIHGRQAKRAPITFLIHFEKTIFLGLGLYMISLDHVPDIFADSPFGELEDAK